MADQTKQEALARFVWRPEDIRIIRKVRPIVKTTPTSTGTKSIPDLHKKQLKIDAKLFGNQG